MHGTVLVWCGAWYREAWRAPETTMAEAHKLDCEAAESDCRFVVQSENEGEAIELARRHMKEVHGKDFGDDELRNDFLQVV